MVAVTPVKKKKKKKNSRRTTMEKQNWWISLYNIVVKLVKPMVMADRLHEIPPLQLDLLFATAKCISKSCFPFTSRLANAKIHSTRRINSREWWQSDLKALFSNGTLRNFQVHPITSEIKSNGLFRVLLTKSSSSVPFVIRYIFEAAGIYNRFTPSTAKQSSVQCDFM